MDQKRLFAAIALSIGILLIFDVWNRTNQPPPPPPAPAAQRAEVPVPAAPAAAPGGVPVPAAPGAMPGEARASAAPQRPPAARIGVESPRLAGTLNLRGARLDDLVLTTYRETLAPNSPNVRIFAPRDGQNPYFAQWGWTAADGRTRVPESETDWTAEGGPLAPGRPVTLSWDNGQGQVFEILLSIDEAYMLSAEQRVRNSGPEAVSVLPWVRVRRDYTPPTAGFFILHEGFTGVLGGRLHEVTFSDAKSEGSRRGGTALEQETTGGWAGITDKYWLAAVMPAAPDQTLRAAYRHVNEGGGAAGDRWQVDLAAPQPLSIAPGASAAMPTRLFAGAKEVGLLDSYMSRLNITDFDKAIDFGWFYFLTKPFFHALHWLAEMFEAMGSSAPYGLAILAFTLIIKILFFPLANKAYHSMAKMKVLAPKMTEIRERYKDDPQKAQQEMMALYRAEKVNPASGCLPILIQIPVFFALYKVLFVSIEMRHQPFFGWISDLSAPDPTNLFNLFGLLPFDPAQWSVFLHMPAWAVIMGFTMWLQMKLNPQPPDPIQAKIFAWMPVIFTFMLASFPAGLIIYWAWNNTLSIAQQYYIMRHERAAARAAKAAGKAK
ncbi:YidC/Oxa1 family membrane protein insertase [Roseomonas alkaliterrae]|uniref:Membrane protein insertase YidC n=2 Tax=Neoroseomonas alkaliterrae TaxID=1452450 RepID=A0A840Y413_9PROT|nr:membrane protein insertase YidC [Neoroseomonas alkaliterrae]MBB5688913.1 YidC/Oxa1 family membrane protein insertase [Neoroseomonas alkaliterrae]